MITFQAQGTCPDCPCLYNDRYLDFMTYSLCTNRYEDAYCSQHIFMAYSSWHVPHLSFRWCNRYPSVTSRQLKRVSCAEQRAPPPVLTNWYICCELHPNMADPLPVGSEAIDLSCCATCLAHCLTYYHPFHVYTCGNVACLKLVHLTNSGKDCTAQKLNEIPERLLHYIGKHERLPAAENLSLCMGFHDRLHL